MTPRLSFVLPRDQWRTASIAGLLLAAGAASLLTSLKHEGADLANELVAIRERSAGSVAHRPVHDSSDFTSALPGAPLEHKLVSELKRSTEHEGVLLISIQVQPLSSAKQSLQLSHISVNLRGPYASVKTVLAEALDRYPSVTVRRLALKRDRASSDTEAFVVLSSWAQPASAGEPGDTGAAAKL